MAGPWRGRGGRGSSGPDNGLGGRDARRGAPRSLEEGVWNPLFLFSPPTGHTTTTTTSSLPSGSRTEEERPGSWAKSSLVSAERKGGVPSRSHFDAPGRRVLPAGVFVLFLRPR